MRTTTVFLMLALSASLFGENKPNIVFMLADDLTRFDIGCYGSKDSKTPTLDMLAAGGMKFTRCYQAAPMCSPTRSGAHPNHTFANPGTKSIVHHLKPLGYRIALSGKRHIGPEEVFPFEYLGKNKNPDFTKVDSFLQEVKERDEPFCLFLCSNEPHTPWDNGDVSLFDQEKIILPPYYVDNTETRENFCHYLAEINYLDSQVKQALELLEKHGLTGNTVFIFASEQGNSFPFAKWTCYNAGLGSALIVYWPGVVEPGTISDALVEYSDITPTMIDIAGGDPVKGLDGSSLLPLLNGERNSHKKYSYGLMTTRGINNGSDYYPIRTVSNGTYRYILNLAPEVEFRNTARMPGWEEAAESDPFAAELVQKYKYRPAMELYNDHEDPFNLENLAGQKPYRRIQKKLDRQLKKWMAYSGDEGLPTEFRAFEHMNRNKKYGKGQAMITQFESPAPSGNLKVPLSGYYTFYIAGEGSVYINEQLIVQSSNAIQGSNDIKGKEKNIRAGYGVIALSQGLHQLELKESNADTQLHWSGPGLKRTKLEAEEKHNYLTK